MSYEQAWAAGFFDGEGTVCLSSRTIMLSIDQVGSELLERFNQATGGQCVLYGPYPQREHQPRHELRACGIHRVEAVFAVIRPYLGSRKRQQAEQTIEAFRSRPRTRPMNSQPALVAAGERHD